MNDAGSMCLAYVLDERPGHIVSSVGRDQVDPREWDSARAVRSEVESAVMGEEAVMSEASFRGEALALLNSVQDQSGRGAAGQGKESESTLELAATRDPDGLFGTGASDELFESIFRAANPNQMTGSRSGSLVRVWFR